MTITVHPDEFHVSTKIKPPRNLPEPIVKAAGSFYIMRVLGYLNLKPESSYPKVDYDETEQAFIKASFVIPRDGLVPEAVEQALRENANFFAHGIVLNTGELYSRGTRGGDKYETVYP